MDFFPKWNGILELPPLPERRINIGGNSVVQKVFGGAKSRATIRASQFKGHDLITFEIGHPFNEVLLRHKGVKRIKTQFPVVTSNAVENSNSLPEIFPLQWDSHGLLEEYASTPEKVREAWKNKFEFRTEDEDTKQPGLRIPQIGALHAISAHFAVGNQFEAATVVLPTGTGKTETMLATQVYRRIPRTLVVVPTDALRNQISNKFITLGILPAAKVVPDEIAKPRVAILSTGLRSIDDARLLVDNSNVIVTLPNTLEACDPKAAKYLIAECTDLIVDEAHHITANTWQKVRSRFAEKRILQFTATPFRRDEKHIDGKIIFNYKLGDAQAADYYRPINLHTIQEYGDQDTRDRAIASSALSALKRDLEKLKLDHLLMARTRSKERAQLIAQIYQELAPEFRPVVVYSGPARKRANEEALTSLLTRGNGGSRIVVCVDMLGEGFDLPNLKIAALHDTHKSLAITLQFIGRFTRKGENGTIGEATVVTNIADQEAEEKLTELYAEGADWDKIIRRLSEERVQKELRLQDVVYGLKQTGNLHAQLSLWNLRPALSTQLFRTTCKEWNPLKFASVLPKNAESWHSFSQNDNVLVAVICRAGEVSWGNYQNVRDTIYDLLILRWDKEAGSLCLFASDYNYLRSEKVAVAVTDDTTKLVSGDQIFNILNNVELPLVKSLGSSRVGAISFTSYFGPNVTEGLASIEKAESSLNNLACLGYENGERVLWGGTQRRGKIWQQKAGTIADWICWTCATWKKVTSSSRAQSNIVKDFLRPEKIAGPYKSHPISVQWGEQAQMRFNDRQFIQFDEKEFPVFTIDLDIADVDASGSIIIRIACENFASEYRLTINSALPGGYSHRHVAGPIVQFRKGSDPAEPIEDYLQKDPFIIRYVDATYSYNCYHIPTRLDAGLFDKDKLESWDWSRISLNKESIKKSGDTDTIQYRTFRQLESEYEVVFNDDGCGEAADLVCLKNIDDESILLTLVHCKGAHGGSISQDIRNFYTVCGQAQKSITAKHAGLPTLYFDLKRREDIWAREGKSRFLKGDMKKLSFFKEKSRRSKLNFEMILVQPGASIATITDDALRLLATTELYLHKTTQAKLRVIISA